MTEQKLVTVMGLGNILLKDEGYGVHFVQWFSQRRRLDAQARIIDGGTLGYGLLDIVTDASHLIVIDVIKTDDEPGAIYRFSREEMELRMPDPTTAHEVEFPDVLCMAELMDACPEVTFLCIVPQCYGTMELEMTPLMTETFPRMEKLLLEELERLHVGVEAVS